MTQNAQMNFKMIGTNMKILKFTAFCCSFLIFGCAAPVKEATLINGSKGFTASCGGTARSWAVCYESANETCATGFDVVDREQFVHDGFVKRTLYFSCKK